LSVPGGSGAERGDSNPPNAFSHVNGLANQVPASASPFSEEDLRLAAPVFATHLPHAESRRPTDLLFVIENWSSLHQAVKAAIVAMVTASVLEKQDRGT
jgi:hypothetical protein